MLKLENMFENFDLVRKALAFWAHDEEKLEEAVAFHNVGSQANRIKCATIGWKAMEEMIEESEERHE